MVQKSDSGTPPEGPRDPFAPPPKDAPDRPWQPRQHPTHQGGRGWAKETPPQQGEPGRPGQDGSEGQNGQNGSAPEDGRPTPRPVVPPPHPWSPGYQGGQAPRPGFGPQQPRFDPSDPVQRQARYALLSGMWGIFFLVLGIPYLTLALASLALYWSISSLRGTAKTPVSALNATTGGPTGPPPGAPGPGAPGLGGPGFGGPGLGGPGSPPPPPPYVQGYVPSYPVKPQLPAALGGLVAAVVGLSLVATIFGIQLYYKNYYDCQANALTQSATSQCATSVNPEPPEWLRKLSG